MSHAFQNVTCFDGFDQSKHVVRFSLAGQPSKTRVRSVCAFGRTVGRVHGPSKSSLPCGVGVACMSVRWCVLVCELSRTWSQGPPRFYSTWVDGTLNLTVRNVAQRAHRVTMAKTLHQHIRLIGALGGSGHLYAPNFVRHGGAFTWTGRRRPRLD